MTKPVPHRPAVDIVRVVSAFTVLLRDWCGSRTSSEQALKSALDELFGMMEDVNDHLGADSPGDPFPDVDGGS